MQSLQKLLDLFNAPFTDWQARKFYYKWKKTHPREAHIIQKTRKALQEAKAASAALDGPP